MKGVTPPLRKLPFLIYRLGTKVNYDDEKECLRDVMRQLALFYIPERIVATNDSEEANQVALNETDALNDLLENTIMPAVRLRFIAPEKLLNQVSQIADLPGLYRVFERC